MPFFYLNNSCKYILCGKIKTCTTSQTKDKNLAGATIFVYFLAKKYQKTSINGSNIILFGQYSTH
jgi:hypothetical protein